MGKYKKWGEDTKNWKKINGEKIKKIGKKIKQKM